MIEAAHQIGFLAQATLHRAVELRPCVQHFYGYPTILLIQRAEYLRLPSFLDETDTTRLWNPKLIVSRQARSLVLATAVPFPDGKWRLVVILGGHWKEGE